MATSRWRGLSALVRDAVDATTDLVGVGHASAHRQIQRAADVAGVGGPVAPIREVVHLSTRGTLATTKAVNRLVALLADTALDAATPVVPDTPPVPLRSDVTSTQAWIADAALGALNGSVGDHLAATGNALDLGMQLRRGDAYLTTEEVDGAVLVMVHGLATTEWCWSLEAEAVFGDPAASLGTLLGEERGLEPIFVRYNTGRPVRDNGKALAEALERHVGSATKVVLLGHSMGGLVARAACEHAAEVGHRWLGATEWVVTVGTPHHGAPLARLGAALDAGLAALDTPTTQVLAGVLSGRSVGVRDLEQGLGEVPLVAGPRYAFVGTTLTTDPEHPVARGLGDVLVQTVSAAGPTGGDVEVRRVTVGGVPHYRSQADPAVLDAVRVLLG